MRPTCAQSLTPPAATPVTTFKKSNKLYAQADASHGGLDRDNDKIACEKA